ncbi:Alkaline phosphatase synthesis sensor protein PhoR [Roseimaritima multifibrata]|uniref:histidine kinase n=1 Tax=Roseimaritima multifibrata TaxID=1930274 RepID=A0A517MM14_9BACT|nr:ATP-binding protein [Roseimaritima multifibrata]QDS95932.1 Alkaline phosphatase synthesis sensor protein PhoR [Roseimaritima multifibrata]
MKSLVSGHDSSRRWPEPQLMIAVGCLFVGTAALVRRLPWELNSASPEALLTIALPVGAILIGVLMLQRRWYISSGIGKQLRALATIPGEVSLSSEGLPLEAIRAHSGLAIGWNRLIGTIDKQHQGTQLHAKLSEVLQTPENDHWQEIFQTLTDGIAITDADGTVLSTNKALHAILRLPAGQILEETNLYPLLSEWSHIPDHRLFASLSLSTCPSSFQLRHGKETMDGVVRVDRLPIEATTGDAQTTKLVWTFRDTTQTRLSEEMRNQFVFTATHELRTPLANIQAYAETLTIEQGIDFEKQKSFYNVINGEATRLARLIDDLLDVSQMETGAINVARFETDVAKMIEEVCGGLLGQAARKQIQLQNELQPGLPRLHADKDKLTAAIMNLAGNAIKYTPAGGTVKIRTDVKDGFLNIHVEDNGIGISEEELPRIGEKFFRSQDARLQEIPGSGLGIAFVQEIARLHGGTLQIHSNLNVGSCFTFSLPAPVEPRE